MHWKFRNINDAFHGLVQVFNLNTDFDNLPKESSRNGDVLRVGEPALITYTHPKERVLFNEKRDTNPFSLLYEALWMLAGRNDVASLTYYTKNFANYSDDGETLNGAYGYRWRQALAGYGATPDEVHHHGLLFTDQLNIIVDHLKAEPNSRRAVLQMWNVKDDLLKIGKIGSCVEKNNQGECKPPSHVHNCPVVQPSIRNGSKDVCCNLSVMLFLREIPWEYPSEKARYHSEEITGTVPRRVLDITVTNRSNDLIWGLLGANYVTFSVLQEYMAARLGVEVGQYHHFTNNLHVYDWNWKPSEWLSSGYIAEYPRTKFGQKRWHTVPLVKNSAAFEKEIPLFVEHFSGKLPAEELGQDWQEPFLNDVASPMLIAWACHKENDDHSAFGIIGHCAADDWRIAAKEWLRRRAERKAVKDA